MFKPALFFSPHFIIKYYLYSDIKTVIDKYDFEGTLLDVGCGDKPYKHLFGKITSYQGIDFKNYSKNKTFNQNKPDIYFDTNYNKTLKLPFGDNSFDNVVSFQVLEHHRNPQKMMQEIVRVCRKNGFILITMPFIWGLHEEPNDYFRFTKNGFLELIKNNKCKIVEVRKQGAIFSTVSVLLNDYLANFAKSSKPAYLTSIIIYLPFLLFSYLCFILDKVFRSESIFLNYLFLIKKL